MLLCHYLTIPSDSGILGENKCFGSCEDKQPMEHASSIIHGDCEEVLKSFPDNFFDLIFTSPPYADRRKNTYGGINPDHYVDWFLPKAEQFWRVLKPTGTFVLNIKERVVNGERHTYVIELILRLREQGWLWTEEFAWHKKNSYPGKWPNRFRDSWERLIQFNKQRKFRMYQEAVMVPVGDWASTRLASLSETDMTRDESRVGSGFGKNVSRDGLVVTRFIQQTLFTWLQNAQTEDTARPSQWPCRLGSYDCSHSRQTGSWIRLLVLEQLLWLPRSSAETT